MPAPLQALEITNFPRGASSFGIPLVGSGPILTTGRIFFVDSTASLKGDDLSHGTTPTSPFATIDFAIGQCAANSGYVLLVLPGHIETITAAQGINCDVAGISICGLGAGRDRPYITLSSSTAASVAINAANVTIRNIVFDFTGIDALNAPLDVNAADFTLQGCEIIFATAAGQATVVLNSDGNSHRLRVLNNLFAGSSNAGALNVLQINTLNVSGTEGIEIGQNRIIGNVNIAITLITSSVGFFSNLYIHDNQISTLGSSQIGLVLTASNGSTGVISGNHFSGTDITALMGITTDVAPYPALIDNFGYDSDTANVQAIGLPIIGNQLAANRSIYDEIIGAEFSYNRTNYLAVTVTLVAGTTGAIATHELFAITGAVRLRIIPEITTVPTSGGSATMSLGVETAGTSIFAATAVANLAATTAPSFWLTGGLVNASANIASTSVIDQVVAGGRDVGYAVAGATFTGGVIVFHCWWEPINSTGAVVAGALGSL